MQTPVLKHKGVLKLIVFGLLLVVASWLPSLFQPAGVFTLSERRPNIILILVDDLRWDAMSSTGSPFMKTPGIDKIASSGVTFSNAFVTTSLCSPSRASFMTGMYAHSHGIRTNAVVDLDPELPTFSVLLNQSGYETAFIGKWHLANSSDPRPGYDYWLSFERQGIYIDPLLNENGKEFQAKGYMTDLLTQFAVDWIRQPHEKPFLLFLSHKAVHAPFTPAERHKTLFANFDFPEPPNYRDTYAGKPEWMRRAKIQGAEPEGTSSDAIPRQLDVEPWNSREERVTNYYRAIHAVDESVSRILDTLSLVGELQDSIIIFTSDNGFFAGYHNRSDKRLAYDEAIRIPLLLAGPGIPENKRLEEMVLNIDIAPSILEIAKVTTPRSMQGKSLLPLIEGRSTNWRKSFLYEYYQENWHPEFPDILGVRTSEWKYIRYPGIEDIDELYNLTVDPHELNNLIDDENAKRQLVKMQAELNLLVDETRY